MLTAALAFPTVIYTIMLCLVVMYWLFVIIGFFDIDMLDFGGDADGLLDGTADGIADGVADGAADGVADAAEGAIRGGAGLLEALDLRSVPITVSFSIIVLVAWVLSILGMNLLGGLLDSSLLAVVVGIAAFVVALPVTSVLVRPLSPAFKMDVGRNNASLVGHTCTIATGRVSETFGQADCQVGRDHLLIQVRCRSGNTLKKGSEALIIEYNRTDEAFLVEALEA